MPLNKYTWSEKYGWIEDKYGISWQLTLGKVSDLGQKITPALMFIGEQFVRAEEAINFYSGIFPDSSTNLMSRYDANDELQAGKINHTQFTLAGQKYVAMDSGMRHEFNFNEGISFVVTCDNQEEIDHYWNALTKDGQERMCGWLIDKFGLSWQIVPSILSKLMQDSAKAQKVQEVFLKMRKFDISVLENV
jgi:predicted 3-demethylubiquinone-9 3-methyltransferase (glyoxalase superfamily)